MSIRKGDERSAWLNKNLHRERGNDLVRQSREQATLGVEALGDLRSPENCTNLEHQMGTPMTFNEIRGLLGILNPNLIVSPMPEDGFAGVFGPDGQGGLRFLHPFDYPIAPEWSVLSTRIQEMPSQDIPEVVEKIDQLEMDQVVTLGAEIIRGWRTLFARLIQDGWFSVEAVERLIPYKGSVRHSWAASLGKIKESPRI